LLSILNGVILDGWFPNATLDDPEMEKRVRSVENQTRAKFQATLAACIKIRAERKAACRYALEKALTATALLRFLSPANFTSRVKSYALPLGMENTLVWHRFHLQDGVIKELAADHIYEGPHEWIIDEMRPELIGILQLLSDLAKVQETDLSKTLLDAMLIYSRNSTTTEPADKLVFILVALESMLLRDTSEQVQSNLGERMAFLVGESLEDKKKIVATVKATYAMRSKFIHHGQDIDDLEIFDAFLGYAWSAFLKLLTLRNSFKTRFDLLNKLDEMKLS
jgi:hypothetical protein